MDTWGCDIDISIAIEIGDADVVLHVTNVNGVRVECAIAVVIKRRHDVRVCRRHEIDITVIVHVFGNDGVRTSGRCVHHAPCEAGIAVVFVPNDRVSKVTAGQHIDVAIEVDVGDVGGVGTLQVAI